MKVEDLKWYSPLVFLVGAILSFADPITDLITLAEFERAGHKTWFGVGLAFVILPSFVLMILDYVHSPTECCNIRHCSNIFFGGFHPFSPAILRLQGFFFCLKKWCCGNEIDFASKEEADGVLMHIDWTVMIEAALESAPQFILQLYGMNVQEEPVEVIQIISLLVSFLSLAWAFTTADETFHADVLDDLKIKLKLALFVTHIFLLCSRLFAICYFIVSFKWWIIIVLLFHTSAIVLADAFWLCQGQCGFVEAFAYFIFLFYLHWLRDDFSALYICNEVNKKTVLKRVQLFSNVLFVIENFVMILSFYISQHSNTWYALPVTVCVCLFSVFGSVMRVFTFHVLLENLVVRFNP